MNNPFVFLFLLLLTSLPLASQRDTLATRLTGNPLLCPETCGTFGLALDSATTYRWYTRAFGSVDTVLITTQTGPTFTVCNSQSRPEVPLYLSAEAVRRDTLYRSPELLVDGLAFLLPFVETTGTFTTGPEGQFLLCPGDSLRFQLGDQTATSVQWYRNGAPLPADTLATLTVRDTGVYTVDSAPGQCPSFITPLGVNLTVTACTTTGIRDPRFNDLPAPFPNPTSGFLNWRIPIALQQERVTLFDARGSQIWTESAAVLASGVDLRDRPTGLYFLRLGSRTFRVVRR